MTTKSSQTDGAPSANKYKILKAAANEDQSLKTRMDRYKQLSNLHMVPPSLTIIMHIHGGITQIVIHEVLILGRMVVPWPISIGQ
jgi:hypothetical protein